MYKSLKKNVVSAAWLAAFSVASVNAASVSYTDRALFDAATTNAGTDNFSALNNGANLVVSSVSRTAGSYGYTASSAEGLYAGAEADGFLSTNVRADGVVLSGWSANITAIGANFFGSELSGNYRNGWPMVIDILESDGDIFSFTLLDTTPTSFFGYVADSSITSLTAKSLNVDVWPSIDNLTLAQAASTTGNDVPEPASAALLGLAIAGLAAVRRRKA